jgi:hypothetical protein
VKALTEDVVAELRAKHGALYVAECNLGKVIYRQPTQTEIDPYVLGVNARGTEEESSNNLVFACRVWPDVATVMAMFDEAPAIVTKFAECIADTAGGGETDLIGLVLRGVESLSDEEKADIATRAGKPFDVIVNEHPRGCLRAVTLPGFGLALFRRPSRSTYAPFVDSAKKDDVVNTARVLCAECAVTVPEKDLAAVFVAKPAISFYLAFALGSLAGVGIEVTAGKL